MRKLTDAEVVYLIRGSLLEQSEFDDNYTGDARRVARIAILVGLAVTYDEGGRPERILPGVEQ